MGVDDFCGKCQSIVNGKWTLVSANDFLPEYVLKWRRSGRFFCVLNPSGERYFDLEALSQSNSQPIHLNDIRSSDLLIHHDRDSLEVAANGGCHMCAYIFDSRRCVVKAIESAASLHQRWDDDFPRGDYLAAPLLYIPDISFRYVKSLLDFILIEDKQPVSIRRGVCRGWLMFAFDRTELDISIVEASSTAQLTPEIVNSLDEWRKTCASKHKLCDPRKYGMGHANVSKMPSRLIKIERHPNRSVIVRLIASSDLESSVQYATLSHCWGKSGSSYQLTTSTMPRFREGVEKDCLSQLFSDAIDTAMAIGLQYIWIDALCIIQDSLQDWTLEYPTMATVFSQAEVNIAATSLTDSSQSLFRPRNSLLATPLVFKSAWDGTGETPGNWILKRCKSWFYHIDGSPLNRRGWVFQESILAPRTLHFAEDQIWWNCRTQGNGEALPNVFGSFLLPYVTTTWMKPRWNVLMEIFSQLELTRKDDKLAAVAGLASAWASRFGYNANEYLAGTWHAELYSHILWAAVIPKDRNYLAPSWSWISLDGAVRWHTSAEKYHIPPTWSEIEGRLDENFDCDPFARTIKATLRVACSLFPVRIAPREDEEILRSDITLDSSIPVYMVNAAPLAVMQQETVATQATSVKNSSLTSSRVPKANMPTSVIFIPDVVQELETWRQAETFFLPVRFCRCRYKSKPELKLVLSIFGIVLEPLKDRSGVYTRVGFLRFLYTGGTYVLSQVIRRWGQIVTMPAERYKERRADGKLVIDIV